MVMTILFGSEFFTKGKSTMKKNIMIIIILLICFFTIHGCTILEPNEELILPPTIVDSESLKIRIDLDPQYFIVDGKVVNLRKQISNSAVEEYAAGIENAIDVDCSRFVFCEDGSVVDLYEVIDTSMMSEEPTLSCSLNDVSDILQIESVGGYYAVKSPNGIEGFEAIDHAKDLAHSGLVGEPFVVLQKDGTVYCQDWALWLGKSIDSEAFPEVSTWTEIVDVAAGKDFVIGLNANGEVLSTGIDFTPKDVIKIDVINLDYEYYVPVALTADGKLIFGNHPQYVDSAIKEAEHLTDIRDFTWSVRGVSVDPLVILAQRSDGSLIGTTNDIYNPEYVSQP